MEEKVFTVPTCERDTIKKAVERFKRKAAAYGVPFSCSFSEPFATERKIYAEEYDFSSGAMVHSFKGCETVEAFNVSISCDVIRLNGYQVIARLEHLEGGNVVTAFTEEVSPKWSTLPPHCDHCNGSHGQKTTYIVKHESGTVRQVGRTCLKDYCGINPAFVVGLRELADLILSEDIENHDFQRRPASPALDLAQVLAIACHVHKLQGYVKTSEPENNAYIIHKLHGEHFAPSEEERKKALAIIETVKSMDNKTAFSNYLDNIKAFAASGYCKPSHLGCVAFAPVAYDKHMERLEEERKRREQNEKEAAISSHVGTIGERITLEIESMQLVTSWENLYGYTYLYKITDKAGNVFVWFSSNNITWTANKIKATIKDHTERDGVRQTIIARCKPV